MVGGHPPQQRGALADLLLRQRRRVLLQLARDVDRGLGHLVGVLDDLTDVAEHRDQLVVEVPRPLRVTDRVDLQVHPRLGGGTGRRVGDVGLRVHLLQRAGDVPAHDDDGVDDALHLDAAARQLRGHRVDEVGHVVRDDLHHRGFPRPAVVGRVRVEQPDDRPPRDALPREFHVRPDRTDQIGRVVADDLLGGNEPVVQPDEFRDVRCLRRSSLHEFVADLLRAARTARRLGVHVLRAGVDGCSGRVYVRQPNSPLSWLDPNVTPLPLLSHDSETALARPPVVSQVSPRCLPLTRGCSSSIPSFLTNAAALAVPAWCSANALASSSASPASGGGSSVGAP